MSDGPSPNSTTGSVDSTESDDTTTKLRNLSRELEQIIHDVHWALNHRILSPTDHPWTRFEANFKCEAAYTATYSNTLTGYLREIGNLIKANPNLYFEVGDVSVHFSRNASRADLFVNHVISGWPAGLVRRSVGMPEMRVIDGEWKVVKYRQAPGIGEI